MISADHIELKYINDIDITIADKEITSSCLREWANTKVW